MLLPYSEPLNPICCLESASPYDNMIYCRSLSLLMLQPITDLLKVCCNYITALFRPVTFSLHTNLPVVTCGNSEKIQELPHLSRPVDRIAPLITSWERQCPSVVGHFSPFPWAGVYSTCNRHRLITVPQYFLSTLAYFGEVCNLCVSFVDSHIFFFSINIAFQELELFLNLIR